MAGHTAIWGYLWAWAMPCALTNACNQAARGPCMMHRGREYREPRTQCYKAAYRERKRMAQQAEQRGKQNIEQVFAAAAAKKQKQE